MTRVPPFRGDQVAAGVVVLTVLVGLVQVRMGWGAGAQLALALAPAAGVGVLVAGCPREPRPYVSAIVTSGLILLALVLVRLGQVLGADGVVGDGGPLLWKLVLLGAVAASLARIYDAAAATLVAGLTLAFVPLTLFEWITDPSEAVQRLLLLVMAIGLALVAVTRRDRSPTHAAQLANAAGVALAAIAIVPIVFDVFTLFELFDRAAEDTGNSSFFFSVRGDRIGWGWELPMLVGGFGLLAYGAVDRQRGPVLVGLLVLATWVASAANAGHESLVGWPLVLAAGAVFMLVVGLRPTTPAPPEPLTAADEPPAPPLPLR